jgi:curved DNA-binding protein
MDYYEILGVNKDASPDEIKKAYRKLAMQHHPDRGGDEDKFKEINEAYDALGDPDKKSQYDNRGRGYRSPAEDYANPFSQQSPFYGDFADIFRERSQSFRDNMRAQRNPDGVVDLNVSLAQAYTGTDINVNVGYANEIISIPAGCRDGTKIRLKGKGPSRIKNLPPGDLIVRVGIECPPDMGRDQDDLYVRLEIDAIAAMTGSDVEFQHISGKVISVKVPPGVQHGTKLRVANWGMPNPQTRQPGHLYALIKVSVPKVTDPQHINVLNIIRKEVNK